MAYIIQSNTVRVQNITKQGIGSCDERGLPELCFPNTCDHHQDEIHVVSAW